MRVSRSAPRTSRVQGNYIGLLSNGTTVAGNRGDGVRINASSHDDLIGQSNPVSSISYYNADGVSTQPVSGWQGIRRFRHQRPVPDHRDVGRQRPAVRGAHLGRRRHELLGQLPERRVHERLRSRQSRRQQVRLVGSYKNGDGTVHGFLFQGTTADLSQSSDYQTIDYPNAQYTYVHSTMGDLAVGNADGPEGNAPDRDRPRVHLRHRPEHDSDRHRLSGFDDHHGLRHLVQRRHELHDLRRL